MTEPSGNDNPDTGDVGRGVGGSGTDESSSGNGGTQRGGSRGGPRPLAAPAGPAAWLSIVVLASDGALRRRRRPSIKTLADATNDARGAVAPGLRAMIVADAITPVALFGLAGIMRGGRRWPVGAVRWRAGGAVFCLYRRASP